MSLEEYDRKRRFDETPEPQGGSATDEEALRFVVQKHDATNLHYDFRLEWDGVLKSWAVPKGPSVNPEDKRLAMMVEDHPLDYRLFEGIIPKGNYGAGTVMVWDLGTYRPRKPGTSRAEDERIMQEGLEKGHITFVLDGQKLKGEFALLRLHRGEKNAWLLVKKGDGGASKEDIRNEVRSAVSGRTMEEIEQGARARAEIWPPEAAPPVQLDLSDAPEGLPPRSVKPMLAAPASAPFDRDGWFFEIKWDGYRAIAEVGGHSPAQGSGVNLYSRSLQPFTARYPEIARSLARLKHQAVLDGEIVVLNGEGRASFQLLQQWGELREGALIYCAFDLLYLDGHDLRGLPLRRRKELLREILPALPNVRYSDHVEAEGMALFEMVTSRGLEGIIAKHGESAYREGRRSFDWLKIKAELRQDAVIAGFTAPRGARKAFGALVLGIHEGEKLVYAGHTGTGFDDRTLVDLRKRLEPLIRPDSPFDPVPPTNAPVTWVEPRLVCSVRFAEWTRDGVMRLPVFLGLREDVPAGPVAREREQPPDVAEKRRKFTLVKASEVMAEIDGRRIKITNPKKVFWPEDGYTKGDLIAYYRGVAPVMLPYLVDRPESMNRHPNGIHGESFFQKDVGAYSPDWLRTVTLHSEADDREIRYLLCQDEATLVYMANLGCIEINPWSSRTGSLDRPDWLIIDLDPEAISFQKVVETALVVREVLEHGSVESVVKTSGATGLHIAVPLGARLDYDQAQQFGHIIARIVHSRIPEWTSLVRSPAQRQGKVYLDYLQNRRGQTIAAAYSVRPRPGAPVSTPLRWDEVNAELDPSAFTIRTVPQRLQQLGDLWQPVRGECVNVERFLAAYADSLSA